VFDGCGHTVSNLKIQNKSDKGKNAELAFINTLNENADIKNVKFDNYTIEGKSGIKKSAGLILTNHGTISGVDIVNVSINNISKKANVAGYVLNNEEDGIIENCFLDMNNKDSKIKSGFVWTNYGKIAKCNTIISVNNKDLASGFVGENVGVIEECHSKGNVESKKSAGGFCGNNSGEINDCKSECSVKAKANKGITICGGFVGENSGIIKNSSSKGEVEGQEFTGGFAGINSNNGEIISSKATCEVKSHTYIATINCGGFVGVDAGKIEDCSFDGKVDGCVDSEKVVGIAVGVALGMILTIVGIYLLVKYRNLNDEISKIDNLYNAKANELETARQNLYNAKKTLQDSKMAYNITKDSHEENVKNARETCKSLSNKCNEYANNGKKLLQELHQLLMKCFIALIGGSVVGLATGLTSGLTAGRKCANVGAFCGITTGEISKCSANNSLIKAKSMYNKHNMCGGFVGINGETGT
ncbi:MAG: hypothetical protein K2G97_01475, partial [Oscillospiraceae bacterium]|nr:hypothetical protein [Oscillospiraceae bacterium]